MLGVPFDDSSRFGEPCDMNAHDTPDPVKQFGAYLRRKRVALGHRNRSAWARELDLPNDRVLLDLENGTRANFREDTLTGVDLWYQLPSGTAADAIRRGILPADIEEGHSGDTAPKTQPAGLPAGLEEVVGGVSGEVTNAELLAQIAELHARMERLEQRSET